MGEVGISVLLDGNLIQASGIARFIFIPTGKEYLLYTLNEKTVQDGVELNKLYVSETGEGEAQLSMISQDDWVSIKGIMAELSKPSATIPNNIQLGVLTAKQYTVGPYKKIAVKDELKNGIIATQLAHQPNETANVIAQPVENQFIQGANDNQSAVETVTVPSAFEMTAPAPEQTAPIALVSDPIPTVQPAPTQVVVPTQPVEAPVAQVVPEAPAVPVATPVAPVQTDINQTVKEVINFANSDANRVIELFRVNGLELVNNNTNEINNVSNTVVETAQTVAPSIDINNIPTATQPVALPTEELSEESIVPSTPTLPVDNNVVETTTQTIPVTNVVSEPTVPVQPQVTEIVQQPVVSQPTIPVQQVIPVQNTVVQPTTIVQPTVQETTLVQPVVTPTAPVETQIVSSPTVPVQPQVTEIVQQPVETQNVVNEVVAPTNNMPVQSETAMVTQEMQNSTVSFDIPEEPTQSIVSDNTAGIPTILPLTAEDLQPAAPVDNAAPVNQTVPQPAEANKAFIDTAGPVVKPIGQEETTATGTPGDSGQN